jgi:lysozyme
MSSSIPHRRLPALAALLVASLAACSPASLPEEGELEGSLDDALRVCAGGPVQHGIDVSEHNGHVDWVKVKASGKSFAFARVSDGLDYPDSEFATNWSAMKAAGLRRGAYQYFRPGQDALKQADLLVAAMGPLGPGDLPPVIDVETANGKSSATVVNGVKAWLQRVKAKTGRDPIIYAAAGFWDTLSNTSQFAPFKLWVANYGADCPYMPSTWTKWAFWQYSESGKVSGVSGPVDLNVWNGTLASLSALAGGPAPASCKTDVDCNHGVSSAAVICANSGASAGTCIDGCHGDGDCPAPGTCDESGAHWHCTNAPPALGTPCVTDSDCSLGKQGSSRVCGAASKTCVLGCHGDSDCPSGAACDKSGPAWTCTASTLPLGAPCTNDDQCGGKGQERICGASSHVCMKGCHADDDCAAGKTCDHQKSPWACTAGAPPPDPNACPVLAFPSGIHIQTVKNDAMTKSYQGHLEAGQAAPTCFLDVANLHDPVAKQTYSISVKVAPHFQLDELVGTEVYQGYGNFVLLRPEAVDALEGFRVASGGPVSVISGFRGPKHQEDVCEELCGNPYGCPGTCANNSRHMWGDAFDLPLDFYSNDYTDLACEEGFKFTYLESGTHLHVDQNPAYAGCVQQ